VIPLQHFRSEGVQLGKQINQELVSSEFRLYRNQEINRYVDQIGQRLAATSRPNTYTFQVVDDVLTLLRQWEALSMSTRAC